MKKLILLLFIPLVFACSSDDDSMSITITNAKTIGWFITDLNFVNYSFPDMNIAAGHSRTFSLDEQEMISGLQGITVTVSSEYRANGNIDYYTYSKSVNFASGENVQLVLSESGLSSNCPSCSSTSD